jgi:hypothetical protein
LGCAGQGCARGAGLGLFGPKRTAAARSLRNPLVLCLRTVDRRRQDIRAARLLLCRGRLLKKIGPNRREAVGN